jgi:hypothetical protein
VARECGDGLVVGFVRRSLYRLHRGLLEQVMFDWLHYRYQLTLLQRKKRQTQRYFAKTLNKARKEQKSVDDLQGLGAEETHELDFIDDDIHQLISNYVRSEAEKHFVPVPRFNLMDGKWERSEVSARYSLNPGRHQGITLRHPC